MPTSRSKGLSTEVERREGGGRRGEDDEEEEESFAAAVGDAPMKVSDMLSVCEQRCPKVVGAEWQTAHSTRGEGAEVEGLCVICNLR